MTDLATEIKQLIIDSLDLEDITVDDIDTDAPLFEEGLGLDSIDALELGIGLHKKYNLKIDSNSDETRKHFKSVATLVELIKSNNE
ncbi:Acyl carrier protein (ACP1) [hydrothermal vent metagenome]|uniref:Acyl carrier protein (ACP1) n=1 Tax=hydrothermal vent metagenome TaxID=652676 RepID=A0A3B0WSX2_9ZZZZ